MTSPFPRASRRAAPALLLPILLAGGFAVSTNTALALRQDAKPADATAKTDAATDTKTYTVARKFKAGDVDRYQINVSISAGQDVTITMLLKNTTKDVKATGGATVLGEIEKASATLAGTDQEITGLMPSLTETMTAGGKLQDLKLEGGSPLIAQAGFDRLIKNFLDIAVYPPKPVKAGDSWEYSSDATQTDQKVKGKATFVGPETINGLQTLKIKTVSDSEGTTSNPMTGEKMNIKTHAEGTQNLDTATGKLVKVQTSTVSEGNVGKGSFTMTLVTGDDKTDKADKPAGTDTGKKPADTKDGAKTGSGR